MTVAQFIKHLMAFPQDAHIGFEWDGCWSKPERFSHFKDENAVIIDVSTYGTFDTEDNAERLK